MCSCDYIPISDLNNSNSDHIDALSTLGERHFHEASIIKLERKMMKRRFSLD